MRVLASLTNRIFLASSLLAVFSIAIAVFVVNARVTADAERNLQRELEDAAALLGDWQATLSENFQLASRLIADSPRLKAALDTGDPQTIEPVAREFKAETRADVLIVTDRQGRPLTVLGPWAAGAAPPKAPSDAAEGRAAVTYWPHADGVLQVITVPVLVGSQSLGAVSLGFVFDRQRAMQLRQRTESEVAFAVRGRVWAATVGPEHFALLASLLRRDGISRIEIGRDEFEALVRPFGAPSPRAASASSSAGLKRAGGGAEAPAAILFQSRTERLRFLREIHTALGVTALLAVIGAIGLSYMVARTVTRPLAALTDGMREMATTGDLTRKVTLPAGNWEDEDARLLATTFNTLTESIARFQREAGQRERLSSLGRLSTIIAHEIRNPLMIIKASLRSLRREPLRPSDAREAAADIEEEVERLNRIVSGVLDFARPIRFDRAPTDVRALCEQSIAAATAGDPDPAVRFSAPGRVPVLETDGERLRGVLVNLVTNARQAVLARREREAPVSPSGGLPSVEGDEPPVAVTIEVGSGSRVAIEIADRGTGMAPADMAKIFEPYFTTKRGGTGLGLAIARNVIDGLGGSIGVRSTEGVGTCVRIELPATDVQATTGEAGQRHG